MTDPIIFPGAFKKEQRVMARPTGERSKSVYPLKDINQIKAMHTYLLTVAHDAKTDSKKRNAYRNWLYFALGINMGFRGGDLSELVWGQLIAITPFGISYMDREDNFIHAEKTGKAHLIVLNAEARKYIAFYYKATKPLGVDFSPETPVFPSGKSAGTSKAKVTGHIDAENMGKILKEAARNVGVEYNFCTHSLRKTFGYHYFNATRDLTTLQRIFGHSSPAITMSYIGMDSEEIIEAYNQKPDTSIDNLDAWLTGKPIAHVHGDNIVAL